MGEYLNTKLFKSISKEEAEKMLKCSMSVERLYKCGEVIFTQNDRPNNIYLLLEGQVIISKYLPSGKRDIILTVKEGQLFGEVFLFSEEDYYWYEAQTMKESRILVMPYAFINGFCSKACDHHKQIIRNLLDIQSEANLNMLKKLHIVKGTTLKQKIALWT